MNFIENQNWRYATKKMDANKKIKAEDLNFLMEAVRLSTSSYGLQPYKIFVIESEDLKEKIKPAAWNQSQVTDSSYVFVFANIENFGDQHIDEFINLMSSERGIDLDQLKGYGDFMKMKINELTAEQKSVWTAKQTYLALGNLLNAAAEIKVDVTPMEGFEPEKVNAILGLDSQHLNASVIATVGYRSEEDATQHYKKVRKPLSELFVKL